MSAVTAAVICPGRGTYNREQLGYLSRYHADKGAFLGRIDRYRADRGQPSVSDLDARLSYDPGMHNVGENVAAIIYACALADCRDIDPERFDIVAVTGNSMGWYLALACAGALGEEAAIAVVNGMGSMMRGGLVGGQMAYPLVDDHWREIPGRRERLGALLEEIHGADGAELYLSIDLGGMWVFGGNDAGLKRAGQALPRLGRYPMRLANHAAFHTPLLDAVIPAARELLPETLFERPHLPMVDGSGRTWQPYATDTGLLCDYTLGAQVNRAFDFRAAIDVVLKEFAPEVLILPGPGSTLVASVAQRLIALEWQGIRSREDFLARQAEGPVVLAMGVEQERHRVVAADVNAGAQATPGGVTDDRSSPG